MIRTLVDDLAFLAVDAVVRPADDRLEPVTPAIARLDQIAGPRFAEQRRVREPLAVGAAVVTGGGDLAAPFVVHAVVQGETRPAERETVRRALQSSWHRAIEWGLVRLAAPLVGTGAGLLTLEDAAGLLAETFRDPGRPDWAGELTIVVEREEDRRAVDAALRRAPAA
jgi:O-acetyl-ADP-ribose deacetylase (regulator of RNase III)